MRELVYLNHVAVDYENLYARAKDYFHRHGVEIDFEFTQTDYKNLSYAKMEFPQGERITKECSFYIFLGATIPSRCRPVFITKENA